MRAVHSGTATLKDATSEAIRDWVTNVESTHYILGSAAGPHPYPMMVCFQLFLTGGMFWLVCRCVFIVRFGVGLSMVVL